MGRVQCAVQEWARHPRRRWVQERRNNPYLDEGLTRETFVQRVLESAPPFPAYYRRMKRVNAEGPPPLEQIPGQQAIDIDAFHGAVQAGHVVIDLRDQTAFGAGHVPGAFGVGAGKMLSMWAAWVVPYDTPLLLVGDESKIEEAGRALIRVGLDDVKGFLRGGMSTWVGARLPVAQTAQITPTELQRQLAERDRPLVLDVRTDDEWREGHLPGALHIMGGYLPERINEIPRDRPLVVMCGSGYRSTIAASVLERAGFTEITNLTGGMKAWKDAGLDTTHDGSVDATASESPMTPQWLAGLALTGLVGTSLGLLGAGGSIIMVPVLVYVVGVEPHAAVPLSLLIVGATSS